jgi:endonuclease/exonuclease/phosphatase family metal-dependent hydrolase
VIRLSPVPVRVPMRFGGLRPYLVRDEPRVALAATIETPYGIAMFVNTHLSFMSWWNGRQLRHVVHSLVGSPRPLVLMGDLNMGPEPARRITHLRSAANHLTFPAHAPTEQLDHVLVGGRLEPSRSAATAMPISDHRALQVDLQAE